MNEWYRLTTSGAVKLMRRRDLTVEDDAKSLLAWVKVRDHVVEAWAYLDTEFVLAQARKLDQIPREKRGLLHGVAVGAKDIILTQGLSFLFQVGIRAYNIDTTDMLACYNSPIYEDEPAGLVGCRSRITNRWSCEWNAFL
jgi:Asp-tRNA(Asn)/Glu-tRNA(Gln) amidotransferase A subunit family amidase